MDAGVGVGLAALVAATIAVVALAPGMLRRHRRRQAEGRGGSMTGIAGGFDAVWRPSAEDTHAQWEAQIEVPAPAPTPGDKGRMEDGRIVIRIPHDDSGAR